MLNTYIDRLSSGIESNLTNNFIELLSVFYIGVDLDIILYALHDTQMYVYIIYIYTHIYIYIYIYVYIISFIL